MLLEEKITKVCVVCGTCFIGAGLTCSQKCHETFVKQLESDFGKEKIVVDAVTGKRYRVPTRYIIEHGLKYTDLQKFPEVADAT